VKRVCIFLVALLALTSFTSAFADIKVGVVNLRTVFESSKRMQSLSEDLKRQFEPQKNKILADQKRLKDEQDKFNRDGKTMSDKQKTDARNKIMSGSRALQTSEQAFVEQLQTKQSSAMKKSMEEIGNTVADIAQKEHFDMILQSGNVVYSNKSLDITNQVITQFDNNKKIGSKS
jgi:outer membrane protein